MSLRAAGSFGSNWGAHSLSRGGHGVSTASAEGTSDSAHPGPAVLGLCPLPSSAAECFSCLVCFPSLSS